MPIRLLLMVLFHRITWLKRPRRKVLRLLRYRKDRDKARFLFTQGNFIEVYIKTPLSVCEERDTKGLYEKARKGEIKGFTGISAPYEEPENPEVVIETSGETVEQSANHLINYLTENNYTL